MASSSRNTANINVLEQRMYGHQPTIGIHKQKIKAKSGQLKTGKLKATKVGINRKLLVTAGIYHRCSV
jgi:hypothetical protein